MGCRFIAGLPSLVNNSKTKPRTTDSPFSIENPIESPTCSAFTMIHYCGSQKSIMEIKQIRLPQLVIFIASVSLDFLSSGCWIHKQNKKILSRRDLLSLFMKIFSTNQLQIKTIEGFLMKLFCQLSNSTSVLTIKAYFYYLTIIRRRRSEYCGIIPRRSRGDYSTIFAEPEENSCFSVIAHDRWLSEQMHFLFSFLQEQQQSRGGHFKNECFSIIITSRGAIIGRDDVIYPRPISARASL